MLNWRWQATWTMIVRPINAQVVVLGRHVHFAVRARAIGCIGHAYLASWSETTHRIKLDFFARWAGITRRIGHATSRTVGRDYPTYWA